jgi:hypothetical protein
MNQEQFKKLLETYGADTDRWPDDLRGQALSYLAENPNNQQLVSKYQALDDALDRYEISPDTSGIQAALLSRLQQTLFDRFIAWLIPEQPQYFWKPALAATLPLVIGIVVGSNVELPTETSYDSWDEEIALLALEEPTTETLP